MSKDSKPSKFKHLINSISTILYEIIGDNIKDETIQERISKQRGLSYNAKKRPSVSLEDYLERIIKYSEMEENTLILALIYIDMICKRKGLILTELNVHRLLFTSI